MGGTTIWNADLLFSLSFPFLTLDIPNLLDFVWSNSIWYWRIMSGPIPWHICVRSDRHGQNIYGPSLATVEATVHYSQRRPRHIVALGLTKAMHEFLTLHYFAIDSAAGWDELLLKRLPGATLLKANVRRHIALDMFEKSHIAPSHRRLPHPSWTNVSVYCWICSLVQARPDICVLDHMPALSVRFLRVASQLVRIVAFACFIFSGNFPSWTLGVSWEASHVLLSF